MICSDIYRFIEARKIIQAVKDYQRYGRKKKLRGQEMIDLETAKHYIFDDDSTLERDIEVWGFYDVISVEEIRKVAKNSLLRDANLEKLMSK